MSSPTKRGDIVVDFPVQLRTRTLDDTWPRVQRVLPNISVERIAQLCDRQVTPHEYRAFVDQTMGLFDPDHFTGWHYVAVTLLEKSSRDPWLHWFGLWFAAHYPEIEMPAL